VSDGPDILEVLRSQARVVRKFGGGALEPPPTDPDLLDRAADEIARLRAEALRYYHADGSHDVLSSPEEVVRRRVEAARRLEAP
jgi:hypothetical protein